MSLPPVYGTPVIGAYGSMYDERAEQLRAQDASARKLADAGADLLHAAFGPSEFNAKVHAAIEEFRHAFIGFVCCGTDRQLAQLEEQKAQAIKFSGPSDEERLMELVEERNREEAQVEEIDRAFEQLPDGIGEPMRLALKAQLGNALDWKNKQISALQDKIERAHAASSATETSEESANTK